MVSAPEVEVLAWSRDLIGRQRTSCLVCGATDAEVLPGGQVRRCSDCGFGWTIPAVDDRDDDLSDDRDDVQPAARRYEAQRRLAWLEPYGPLGPLLQVGCAGGSFVAAATEAGIDARGVDTSDRAVAYATDTLGVPVTRGTLADVPLRPQVQTLCAFHLLERVADPEHFLRLARRRLQPGGLLALEVPNFASAAADRRGADWPGLQLRHHRWHFSPAALTQLVAAHGFEVISTDTTTFRHLMPPAHRRRHPGIAWADLRATGTLRRVQPARADLLRLLARRVEPS